MKTANIILGFFVVFYFTLSITASPVQARNVFEVNLLSAPFGTASYVICSALEDLSKKHHEWLRINHTESPGLVYNIKKMEEDSAFKKNGVIVSSTLLLWFSRNGMKPLNKVMGRNVKLIGVYNICAIWFGTLNQKIKTPADLASKKVALGTKAQIGWGILADWYLDIGWGLKGKTSYQWIGMKPGLTALMDGLVDAIPIGGYLNPSEGLLVYSDVTNELVSSGKKVYHLSVGEEAIEKVKKAKPGYPGTTLHIPAARIKGTDTDITTTGNDLLWAVSDQFPEDVAYELTRMIIDHVDKFKNYHGLGKLMSKKALLFGLDAKVLHPGAYRAYKEAGLMQ